MSEAQDIWVVLVTAPATAADSMARALVERRLAACVNVVPGLQSFFHWEGRLDAADEVMLLIKTTQAGYPGVERGVRELHPYQVPEIIALPVAAADAKYRAWVLDNVARGGA